MAQIKEQPQLGVDIWLHLAQNPQDTAILGAAEKSINAGTMTLAEAQAHPFAAILVDE